MFVLIKVFDFDFSILQAHQVLHPLPTTTHFPPPPALLIESTPLICNYYWYLLYYRTRQRACLHGGEGPQVGEVTRLGGVTRLSI